MRDATQLNERGHAKADRILLSDDTEIGLDRVNEPVGCGSALRRAGRPATESVGPVPAGSGWQPQSAESINAGVQLG